jgi:hypothetical protein
MKKILSTFLTLSIFSISFSFAQEVVEWEENLTLTAEHFKIAAPQVQGAQTIRPTFLVQIASMMSYEILFGKNFNDKVNCYLISSSSWLDEGERSAQLLRYAQMAFNIYELTARKLRKDMFDNRGKLNPTKLDEFYKKNFDEGTQLESLMAKETNFGSNNESSAVWEEKIKVHLAEYADFCKTCKPEKKKSK